jgi:hypothetical protein
VLGVRPFDPSIVCLMTAVLPASSRHPASLGVSASPKTSRSLQCATAFGFSAVLTATRSVSWSCAPPSPKADDLPQITPNSLGSNGRRNTLKEELR